MPLLGRRADQAVEPQRAPLRVLRADGQRIDLKARTTGPALAAARQSWQAEALAYRDMIGELRYAVRLRAQQVARCRFYPAATRPWPQDPAPLDGDDHGLDPQLVADALHNFGRIPFDHSPDGFTSRLDENLGTVGEVWLHIDADDTFHVRSVSEVKAGSDGKVTIQTLPTATPGTVKAVDPDQDELLRLWIGHPEWAALADAPMRALLDVCEDVVLAGREARAAARSRLAANGILLVPASLSLATTRDDEAGDDPGEDTFMADFTTAMLASVRDDGEPQAVVPIVLRGEIEDLEKVRHVTMTRAAAADLVERQSSALLRMLKGLDIQPEQVEGVGAVNHWTGWLIDSRSVNQQVGPAAESLGAAVSQAYLRPALESLGHPADQVKRIVIAVDVSALTENPNRGQDARDAHAAFAISDEVLRRELGFDEEDKPDDDEVVRRLATSGRLSVDDTAKVLGLNQATGPQPQVIEGQVTPALPADQPEPDRPVARPGEVQAEQPVPDTRPEPGAQPAITAAAEQELLRCDPDLSRQLADIDAALVERIMVASDAAVARVVERAGARVRSHAQKDRAVLASIAGLDAARIPATLGRPQVEAFVPVQDLVADEYTRLRGQVSGWLRDAADQAGRVLCQILGRDPAGDGRAIHAAAVSRLTVDLDGAWAGFADALSEAAEQALFDPDGAAMVDEPGERSAGLVPAQDVVDLLADTGGAAITAAGRHRRREGRHRQPGGGFATGPVILRLAAEQGAVYIGREWAYRSYLVRDGFPPHEDLNGVRFTGWTDPVLATPPRHAWIGRFFGPSDHKGCLCTSAPLWAVPVQPDGDIAARLRQAQGDPKQALFGDPGQAPVGAAKLRDRVLGAVEALRARILSERRKQR